MIWVLLDDENTTPVTGLVSDHGLRWALSLFANIIKVNSAPADVFMCKC